MKLAIVLIAVALHVVAPAYLWWDSRRHGFFDERMKRCRPEGCRTCRRLRA